MLHHDDSQRVIAWRDLIAQTLGRSGYARCAEDVAQDMVIAHLQEFQQIEVPHDLDARLPTAFRREAFRKAREEMRGPVALGEMPAIEPSYGGDPDDATSPYFNRRWRPLETRFSSTQIDSMTELRRRGPVSRRELAAACGIPDRTFRYKVSKLRTSLPG